MHFFRPFFNATTPVLEVHAKDINKRMSIHDSILAVSHFDVIIDCKEISEKSANCKKSTETSNQQDSNPTMEKTGN